MKKKRDGRVWKSALKIMHESDATDWTADELGNELGSSRESALQVLRRLRSWGYVTLIGFAPAADGIGRNRHRFQVTDRGHAKAKTVPT